MVLMASTVKVIITVPRIRNIDALTEAFLTKFSRSYSFVGTMKTTVSGHSMSHITEQATVALKIPHFFYSTKWIHNCRTRLTHL
jgi:hypothetical protein